MTHVPASYDIMLQGNWPSGRIEAHWTENSRPLLPEIEQLIDATWDQLHAQPGIFLFDGPMCRLEGFSARDGILQLALSRTQYRTFLGTNLHHPELASDWGEAVLANPLGLSCLLTSGDGELVLGRRNSSVAYYPDRVHPFAGALEPRDPMDIFAEMRRELTEELGLHDSQITSLRCLGIVRDLSIRQPEMIFAAQTTLSTEQLRRGLDAKEHAQLVGVQAAAAGQLLSDYPLTPVARAALDLLGRTA